MKLVNPTDKYKESYFDLIRCAKENGGIFEKCVPDSRSNKTINRYLININ